MADDESVHTEEHHIQGDGLVTKLREILRQGNIRRVIIKNGEGKTLIEIPLTLSRRPWVSRQNE